MLFRSFLIAGLILSYQALSANDSLIYRSRFEERLLLKAASGEVDYLALYTAITKDSVNFQQYAKKIGLFYGETDKNVNAAKTAKAKMKLLFKEVHEYFFVKYEEEAFFSQIFDNGNYNCVTASMLYAIIFDHYQIPFEIKETPTHVYLVAFPGSENIMVETTNPNGLLVIDDKSKRDFVQGLVQLKFTTQDYVNSIGPIKAFNEFYYNSGNIDRKQLGSMQYNNAAVFASRNKQVDDAIHNIIKAYMLNPSPKHLYLKTVLIGEKLDNSEFENLQDIYYLCEYVNISKDVQSKKLIVGQFQLLIDKKLYKDDDAKYLSDVYQIISDNLTDKKIVDEIAYHYYLHLTQWYSMKNDIDKSLEFGSKAYALNQKDIRLQDLIVKIIYRRTEMAMEGEDFTAVDKLVKNVEAYPFLKTDAKFKSVILLLFSSASMYNFQEDNPTEGYKYLARVEELALAGMENANDMDKMMYSGPWQHASLYHFRRKEYGKAKDIINKGLKIFPGDKRLEVTMEDIRREEAYRRK